jgi:hypothetical protein
MVAQAADYEMNSIHYRQEICGWRSLHYAPMMNGGVIGLT